MTANVYCWGCRSLNKRFQNGLPEEYHHLKITMYSYRVGRWFMRSSRHGAEEFCNERQLPILHLENLVFFPNQVCRSATTLPRRRWPR